MATNPSDLMKQFDQTGSSPGLDPVYVPQQSIDQAPPPQPQGWGDLAKDTGRALVGSSEQQIGNAERWFGSTIDDYDLSKSWRDSGNAWNKSGQDWMGSMTPAGQQTTNAPIFSQETWEHPINKLAMGIGKGGLWNLAMVPGGGAAAMVGRAGLGAALSYTGAYGDVVDSIKNVPDDQLQKSSPQYLELRKTYPEFQAKQMLADQAWDNVSGVSKAVIAGTGALAGEAGPLATVGKTVVGTGSSTLAKLAEGKWAGRGLAAAETGGVQAGQYAGSAIPTRQALTSVGAPADTPSQIAWGTIEQGAVGAVVGGGGKFFRPEGGKNEANSRDTTGKGRSVGGQVVEVPAGQADPAQAASLQSATQPIPGAQPKVQGATDTPQPEPLRPPQPGEPPVLPIPPRTAAPQRINAPPEQMAAPEFTPTPKPPFTVPPPGTQRPLGINVPEQPHPGARGPQFELPLRQPETPPVQGELDLTQPRQPVIQPGLPGMGADVVHEAGEPPVHSAEGVIPPAQYEFQYDQQGRPRMLLKKQPAPSTAEPEADTTTEQPAAKPAKPAKAPVTKDSDEQPAAAAPAATTKAAAKPKTGPEIIAAAKPAAKAAAAKAAEPTSKAKGSPAQAAWYLLSDPQRGALQEHLTGVLEKKGSLSWEDIPKGYTEKFGVSEATSIKKGFKDDPHEAIATLDPNYGRKGKAESAAKGGTATGTFDTSEVKNTDAVVAGAAKIKALKAAAEAPVAPVTKAEAKRLAAIDKLVGTKEKPTQVERPTVEPTGEPKVTVVPPTDARLKPITPGAAALKAAAEAVAKLEKTKAEAAAPEPKVAPVKTKGLSSIKQGLIAKAKAIEDAKAAVEPNPTEAQKAAGNFKQGHPPASATQGQPVTIHSAEGEVGEAEGHILGTAHNIPAEHLETLIRSKDDTGKFYVINKYDEDGHFAGHIAVQGAHDVADAYQAYLDKLRGEHPGMSLQDRADRFSGVVAMSPTEFEHFKQTRNPNEPVYPSTEGQHPFGEVEIKGGKKVKTLGGASSSTAKAALEQALRDLPDDPRYSIYRKLAEQVMKYLPDVPIYYVKTSDLGSSTAGALYNVQRNQILMGDKPVPDMPHQVVLLHEIMHATMQHLYSVNKIFRTAIDRLHAEYLKGLPKDEIPTVDIRTGGAEEFIAELANPVVQRQMTRVLMSKRLAEDLDMGEWAKSTQTLWNGAVKAFKDGLEKLGFKLPGKDDASRYTILDGMLRMSDDAFMHRSRLARSDFANMTRAVNEHNKGIETTKEVQHNSQQNVVDTVHEAATNPHVAQERVLEKMGSISSHAEDLLDKAPRGILKAAYYDYASKLVGTDAFRRGSEKFFGALNEANPMRKYVETTYKRDADFQHRTDIKRNFVADMAKAKADIGPEQSEKLGNVLTKATAYRADPRDNIGEGRNAWLKGAADRIAAARAKGEEDPNLFYKHQQAINKHAEITNEFNDLHPTAQKWFGKLVDDYREKGRARAEANVDELLHTIDSEGPKLISEPKLDPNDPASRDKIEYAKYHNNFEQNWDKNKEGLRKRILDDELTERDKEWLDNRGIDNAGAIQDLSMPKGPYVPLDHSGDMVIEGRYKIDTPANAKKINDNTFEFKTDKEMKAFLAKQPPNSRPYVVHYNDEGKAVPKWEKWQNADGSVGYAKDNRAWRVEVNDKYFSGHDGIAAANRRYKTLQASGLFSKLSEPEWKQGGWHSQLELSSPMYKKLLSAIDKRTDYDEGQKKAAKQLLSDAAISSMEGNRVAKTLLPRKLVAGWDTDFLKTYDKYADMHNALMSRLKFNQELNAARDDMIKYTKDHRYDGPNTGGTERSGVLTELQDRNNFFGSPDYVGNESTKFGQTISPVLRKMMTLSFLQSMGSVGHSIVHSTHQIITADMVAGKFGGLGTMAEAVRLHSILGGAGFKNVLKSISETVKVITKDSRGLNYVESLVNKLETGHRYGPELKAFDRQSD